LTPGSGKNFQSRPKLQSRHRMRPVAKAQTVN
jgi:hypothetical protein